MFFCERSAYGKYFIARVTQHRSKSFFLRIPYAASARFISDALSYLSTYVFNSLGLLLSLGLVAAACTLYQLAKQIKVT